VPRIVLGALDEAIVKADDDGSTLGVGESADRLREVSGADPCRLPIEPLVFRKIEERSTSFRNRRG
jgi:hypothetical protein